MQNVPHCKAEVDLKVGMGVVVDLANKIVSLPASEEACKGVFYIVTNINDKPEMHNFSETLVVKKGEFVRADDLTTVANLEAEFSAAELADFDSVSKGDKLVFGTDGLLAKKDDVTGYKVYFEVTELTAYMGKGIQAVIRVQ